MNLLVIDTATEACSVALEVNGQIYNQFEICPQQHSQRILPMIDQILGQAGIQLSDLDYLGFGRGPGSFTGVRIATGIIQGLGLGTDLKVVGVSTLAAMAQQVLTQPQYVALTSAAVAIDARMAEVYFGQYALEDGVAVLLGEEQVLPPEDASQLLPKTTEFCTAGTGWEAYPQMAKVQGTGLSSEIRYPDAKFMLPLAKLAISHNMATSVDEIEPVYLRDKVTWKKLPGRE